MSPKEEDDVRAADTFSQSSHEGDEDSDDDDKDDIHDSHDIPFWRQHWLAALVAVLAASATHFFHSQLLSQSSTLIFPFLEPSTSKHAHLGSFDRTANISFCNTLPRSKDSLDWMDFYIPRDHYEVLQAFYLADEAEDDYYDDKDFFSPTRRTWTNQHSSTTHKNPEFQCLLEQGQRAHASGKFKGTTYFYKTPTMDQIYPNFAQEGGVVLGGVALAGTPMSRQRKLQQPPLTFTGFAAKFVNLSPNQSS
jgi:hypothetical protein